MHMRSRGVCNMSGSTLMGLAVGVAAGLTAGLLAAPLRGSDLRAVLRQRAADGSERLQSFASSSRGWVLDALDRGLMLIEDGRRAFRTSAAPPIATERLTATIGEIAQSHGQGPIGMEARS
jgi:hypothetical protein